MSTHRIPNSRLVVAAVVFVVLATLMFVLARVAGVETLTWDAALGTYFYADATPALAMDLAAAFLAVGALTLFVCAAVRARPNSK